MNDAPIANADLRTTNEDTPLVIAASSLTANDTDVNGDTLTVTSVSNASHGTVSLVNGNITFTPDANFSGIARFDYTISDGHGGTSTATATIDVAPVADAPVGVADLRTTNEDSPLVIAASSLTANDTDADGDALTVTSVSNASHGTVALVNGNITFTPTANFSGLATFDYTISDGHGGTSTATATIDVAPLADAPVLVAQQVASKVGGEFLVNTTTANNQQSSEITALASGGFVVVWEDSSGQGGDASLGGIKAQIFNSAGSKVGSEFLVNTFTQNGQSHPVITALTNGGFVVTWDDQSLQGGDASPNSIKAQIFNATGGKIGGEFLVSTGGTDSDITALSNGGFVVTWADGDGSSFGSQGADIQRVGR